MQFIQPLKPEEEYYFHEGCFIVEVSNSPADAELSIARARVEPGVTTQWHQLKDTTERYLILAGQGQMEIGDNPPTLVTVGDVVIIPPAVKQRITNTSDEDLLFAAICTPRFQRSNYCTP